MNEANGSSVTGRRMRPIALAPLLLLGCGPARPVAVASGEEAPLAIAADVGALYWLNAGVGTPAAVRKLTLSGGAPQTLAAGGFAGPRAIIVDGPWVYWAAAEGGVRKVPRAGGEERAVAAEPAGFTPFALAVAGGKLYWLATSATRAVLASAQLGDDDGPRQEVLELPPFTVTGPSQIASDGQTVYWVQSDGAVAWLGPAGAVSLATRQGELRGVVIVGDQVWWAGLPLGTQALMRKRRDSMENPTVVALVPGVTQLLAEGAGALIASYMASSISRVSAAGEVAELASETQGASGVAVAGSTVYYLVAGSGTAADGRVMRIR